MNRGSELPSDALQSWKEIAAYLKRGVRTAQRWERSAGLPVHRPNEGDRSPVFALASELDRWMHSRPTRKFDQQRPTLKLPTDQKIGAPQ